MSIFLYIIYIIVIISWLGFAPFGNVISGLDLVNKINSQYGQRPDQSLIYSHGNSYLKANFPNLDYILIASISAEEEQL